MQIGISKLVDAPLPVEEGMLKNCAVGLSTLHQQIPHRFR